VYYFKMANYSSTMDFLHQKLLSARNKDQEDRIVNLMLAESQRNHKTRNTHDLKHQTETTLQT